MKCTHCGHDNSAGHRFCGQCGSALTPADTARLQGLSGSYTPPHLAEKILRNRSALEGERKQVTVLFCDIANSTVLAQRVGEEQMHKVLDGFFELALDEVHKHEGTINQFLGDGFMALFGAPVAHEDHARRAVLAGLAIRQRLANASAADNTPSGELTVRMGLNTGVVVVGKIGDNLRMDYTAVGDTTNVAARVQGLASAGQVLLTDATLRAAEGYVECRSLGTRQVKGKDDPLAIHEVLRARSAQEVKTERLAQSTVSLVGREGESDEIGARLRSLQAGQGGLICVLGEAGLGKSRLLAEVQRRDESKPVRWLEGVALSFGRTLSYWPFLELLKAYFQLSEQDPGEAALEKMESTLTALLPEDEVGEILPYLATLLALPLTGEYAEKVRYLDGQGMGSQVFRTMRTFFQYLSAERPLALLFEDWHWADASSVELLEHLLPLAADHAVLICLCARPDEGVSVQRIREVASQVGLEQRTLVLTLLPLDGNRAVALAHALLGAGPLASIARDALLRVAGGNPLFLDELIKSSVETGALTWNAAAGEWIASQDLARLRVPDTLQGVIMARIDRLDDEVRQVLRTASVIGRAFFYRVLRAVSEAGAGTESSLRALQQVELIHEKQRLPELEYLFKHALVQEATYDSMLADRRRALHRQVGSTIEQLFASRISDFYPVLAYHFAKAEDWQKAQEYLFKAGDKAGDVAGDDEAVEHYRLAIAAHERAFGDRWAPLQRASLHRRMGEALFRTGQIHRALTFFTDALRHLGRPYPVSKAAVRMELTKQLLKHIARALVPGGRRVFRARGARQPEVAGEAFRIILALGWIHVFQDTERMALDTLLCPGLAEESGDPEQVASITGYLGQLFDILGMHAVADHYHRRAIPLAEACQSPVALGHACFATGMGGYYAGKWDDALARLARGADAFRGIGHFHLWGGPQAWRTFVLAAKGDPLAASLSREIVDAGVETRDRELQGWGLMGWGGWLRQAGEYDTAIDKLQSAVQIFESISDANDCNLVLAETALCLAHKQEFEQALRLADSVLLHLRESGAKGYWGVHAHGPAAEVYVMAAERMQTDEARKLQLLGRARQLVRVGVKQGKAISSVWAPESLRLLGVCRWLAGHHNHAQAMWKRAAESAERLGARYTLAQIHLEVGSRLKSSSDIEKAVTLFEDTGCPLRAAAAREQLSLVTG